MSSKIEKLRNARANSDTFEIASILAADFADQPQMALNEVALESPFTRVAFIMRVRNITSRVLAGLIETHENYLSRCLTNQEGLTRKWQKLSQVLGVPQEWLAFGTWNGESQQSAIDKIRGVESPAVPSPLVSQTVKVYSPRAYTPIRLLIPAFGHPKRTVWWTTQRDGKMYEKIILEMKDGVWKVGWMILPIWQDRCALIAPDAGTGGPDLKAAAEVPLNQIQNTYVVVAGPVHEPLREVPAVNVYEADLPDDYEDQEEDVYH